MPVTRIFGLVRGAFSGGGEVVMMMTLFLAVESQKKERVTTKKNRPGLLFSCPSSSPYCFLSSRARTPRSLLSPQLLL